MPKKLNIKARVLRTTTEGAMGNQIVTTVDLDVVADKDNKITGGTMQLKFSQAPSVNYGVGDVVSVTLGAA